MASPLTANRIQELYGSLRRVLHECPATKIRVIAGAAGLDEGATGTRRPTIESAVDGQWLEWAEFEDIRSTNLRHLAQELIDFYTSRGMEDRVQRAILKNGFRFENGDFVPVDASGRIPE